MIAHKSDTTAAISLAFAGIKTKQQIISEKPIDRALHSTSPSVIGVFKVNRGNPSLCTAPVIVVR